MHEDQTERFFSKVDFDDWNRDACWTWRGKPSQYGYGRFSIGPRRSNRIALAHVWSYEFANGPVPEGMHIHHNCGNPLCVNPVHLEVITPTGHAAIHKFGEATGARNLAKTHCPKGHPYSGENLRLNSKGRRECRLCANAAKRKYLESNRDLINARRRKHF